MGIWNRISTLNGKTLVNIVGEIWDAGATLVNNIKSGLSNFAEKVKAGMEYITNVAITLMLDTTVFVIQQLLFVIVDIAKAIMPSMIINKLVDGISINNNIVRVYREELSLIVTFNNIKLNLGDLFVNFETSVETLGLQNPNWLFSALGVIHDLTISSILIAAAAKRVILRKALPVIGLGLMIALTLLNTNKVMNGNYEPEEKENFKTNLIKFLIITPILPFVFAHATPQATSPSKFNFASSILGKTSLVFNKFLSLTALIVSGFDILKNYFDSSKPVEVVSENLLISVLDFSYLYLNLKYLDNFMKSKQRTTNFEGNTYKNGIYGMRYVQSFVKFELTIFFVLAFIIGEFF